eukprot:PLAT7592.1.p1 GENE.PLAT7592.1~~PLAT7592.1.p1  ORF type:complete len:654 (+),score=302.06 PLAT7592.1:852-2813(+)
MAEAAGRPRRKRSFVEGDGAMGDALLADGESAVDTSEIVVDRVSEEGVGSRSAEEGAGSVGSHSDTAGDVVEPEGSDEDSDGMYSLAGIPSRDSTDEGAVWEAAAMEGASLEARNALVRAWKKEVPIKNRMWLGRSFVSCFVGEEAVDWLVTSGRAESREAAVTIGKELVEEGVVQHVTTAHDFKDDYLFYKFRHQPKRFWACEDGSRVSVEDLISEWREHVPIRDRVYRRRVYKTCFVGQEAVDWLVKSKKVRTRVEAVRLGQRLMNDKWLVHVVSERKFRDGYRFYRFVQDSLDDWTGCDGSHWRFTPHIKANSMVLDIRTAEELEEAVRAKDRERTHALLSRLRDRVVKQVRSVTGWQLTRKSDATREYKREEEGSFHTVKVVGVVPVAPRQFLGQFLDFGLRGGWESLFGKGYTVQPLLPGDDDDMVAAAAAAGGHVEGEEEDDGDDSDEELLHETFARYLRSSSLGRMLGMSSRPSPTRTMTTRPAGMDITDRSRPRIIYRTSMNPNPFVHPRDIVSLQDYAMLEDGTAVVYELSVQHPDEPKRRGYVRAEIMCMAHVAEPVKGKEGASRLTLISQVDPKGRVPGWLSTAFLDNDFAENFGELPDVKGIDLAAELERKVGDDSEKGGDPPEVSIGLKDFSIMAVLGRG